MARKERDSILHQEHQYASKIYNYLTPPSTPRFDSFSNDDESELLNKDAFLPEQFSLYSSDCFANCDDNDPFYDFAEDFQDLCRPLLKSDCMWGTAAQIRSSRISQECSSDSVTTCSSSRNITATPLQLTFRSTATTPVCFDVSSNHFMPISSTISPSEIENRPKDLISPFSVFSSSQVSSSVQLLSPNETESEDEIDVVSVPERLTRQPSDILTTTAERTQPKASEKPKKSANCSKNAMTSSATNSSDTDESTSSRARASDSDEIGTGRSRNPTSQVRVSHNDLERKRRDELKRKFDCLRAVVPEIESNERAPKVIILKKASAFVSRLQEEERALKIEKETARRINGLLMQKLLLMAKKE